MSKFIALLCGLTLSLQTINARQLSAVERLSTLGQFWGFLKYYHPDAAKGHPDWDSTAVEWIRLAEKPQTTDQFFSLLQQLYNDLPKASLNTKEAPKADDSTRWIFSERDIVNMRLPGALQNDLIRLFRYHRPDTSVYITGWYKQYKLDFINHTEISDETAYPSREKRVLALFRYWNTIRFFYPHITRIANWTAVLTKYIPRFAAATDSNDFRLAVLGLIHELPDAHSFYRHPDYTKKYQFIVPVNLQYIDGHYLVAKGNDVFRRGDEIISVGGKHIKKREAALMKIVTGTNPASLHRDIAQDLFRTGDTNVDVVIKREKKILRKQLFLTRSNHTNAGPANPLWEKFPDGTWYIRFCEIRNPDTLAHLFRDIKDAKAVIWEMRAYPNYNVTLAMQQYLFHRTTLISTDWNAVAEYPGMFRRVQNVSIDSTNDSLFYKGRMIVLVDEHTQSLAESVAASLRLRPNTLIMGRQTAGTTGNITWLELPGAIQVSYTGVNVEGSNNSFRQGQGVSIDVPVQMTKTNFIRSNDYILDEAKKLAATFSPLN